MPLPGRDKTFALENCRDLLNKLEREVDRLRAARAHNDITTMIDTAFNAAVTAWHLCDWVFGDMTIEQREKLKVRDLSEFQEMARREYALHVCRQIATASKHWEISNHADAAVGVSVTASSEWGLYIIDGDKRYDAVQLFDETYTFWTQLIYQNAIAR
jgi:hypothetical protein